MRVDPESVLRFGRSVWQASDGVAEIRVDTTLSAAATGMKGSDLSHGMQQRSAQQQQIVDSLASDLNAFGLQIKNAADEYLHIEDAAISSFDELRK